MKSLSFFEEAAEEIEQERHWYRDRSVVAETSFLRELDHAVESVLESATRWRSQAVIPMAALRLHRQLLSSTLLLIARRCCLLDAYQNRSDRKNWSRATDRRIASS